MKQLNNKKIVANRDVSSHCIASLSVQLFTVTELCIVVGELACHSTRWCETSSTSLLSFLPTTLSTTFSR